MVDINLDLLNESLDRVGKRELPEKELRDFIVEVLKHETHNLKERKQMFVEKKIVENDINNFEYFNDGYRCGVFIKMTEDAIMTFKSKDEKGNINETDIKVLFKKDKQAQYMRDDKGDFIPTDRCVMRLKCRLGFTGIFLGREKAEQLEKDESYVLVGGMSLQWKVANATEDIYHKKKEANTEYGDKPSYTLNLWQLGHIVLKNKKLIIELPACNWKPEEETNGKSK
jgi:hypothetical protein